MLLLEFENKGNVVYHVTHSSYLPKLNNEGLKLMQTSNWVKADQAGEESRYFEEPMLFAFESALDAFRWAFKQQWELKQPAAVLRIKNDGKWFDDPSEDFMLQAGQGKALARKSPVPPTDIVDTMELDDLNELMAEIGGTFNDAMEQHPWNN